MSARALRLVLARNEVTGAAGTMRGVDASGLSDLDARYAQEALLCVRLAMRTALGRGYFEAEVSGEPDELRVVGYRVLFDFEGGDVSYEWDGERYEVLEMRRRAHFLDVRAFDRFGKLLARFQQPLGRPEWN